MRFCGGSSEFVYTVRTVVQLDTRQMCQSPGCEFIFVFRSMRVSSTICADFVFIYLQPEKKCIRRRWFFLLRGTALFSRSPSRFLLLALILQIFEVKLLWVKFPAFAKRYRTDKEAEKYLNCVINSFWFRTQYLDRVASFNSSLATCIVLRAASSSVQRLQYVWHSRKSNQRYTVTAFGHKTSRTRNASTYIERRVSRFPSGTRMVVRIRGTGGWTRIFLPLV